MKDNTVNGERDALTGEKGRQEESLSGDSSRRDGPRLRRVRLKTLLRELVDQEGRMEAAEMLGVNYRTLVRAEETGHFTGRMRDALHRLIEPRQAPEVSRLAGRVTTLDWRVKKLETRLREMTLANAVEKADVQPTVEGHPSSGRATPQRRYPGLVAEDPSAFDAEVYGDAWPLVEEWRRLRTGHPSQGRTLSWLTTEERLLTLELAMMEQHDLTLPPETQPLRGFGRRDQIAWRREALRDTRKALARRKLLRRIFTLGLWWG